jgi:hypothetical protein
VVGHRERAGMLLADRRTQRIECPAPQRLCSEPTREPLLARRARITSANTCTSHSMDALDSKRKPYQPRHDGQCARARWPGWWRRCACRGRRRQKWPSSANTPAQSKHKGCRKALHVMRYGNDRKRT